MGPGWSRGQGRAGSSAHNKISRNTKFWQALPKFGARHLGCDLCKKSVSMSKSCHIRPVVPDSRRGWFQLPSEGARLCLNPAESTLYRLFLGHPEGLVADDLVLHWKELWSIYAHESCFDDPQLRENALVSLCSESKRVFYSNIARIKRKFVNAIGARKARGYYIKRYPNGRYRTLATLAVANMADATTPTTAQPTAPPNAPPRQV